VVSFAGLTRVGAATPEADAGIAGATTPAATVAIPMMISVMRRSSATM
jgi:hypothetical protein